MITSWLSQTNNIKYFGTKFRFLLIAIVCLILALIFTYPLILNINSRIVGDGGDNYLNIVFQYIFANKIRNISYPFVPDITLRYPVGFDFQRGFDMPLIVITGGLLNLVSNSIISYNLTFLFFLTFNAIASYILFYHLSKSRLIGIIGVVMFGFSFYTLSRGAGHIGHGMTAGYSLFIYSILRLKNDQRFRSFLLLFISILIIVLVFLQHLLLLSILILVNIPIILILFRIELKQYIEIFLCNKKSVVFAFLLFIILFIYFTHPYIEAIFSNNFVEGNRLSVASNIKIYLQEFIAPNPYSKTLSANLMNSSTPSSIENIVFIGWLEILLFFLFLFKFQQSKIKYFFAANILIFFVLSLGLVNPNTGVTLPYNFLFNYFPFHYIPEPGRYIIFISLFSTIAIVLLLKSIKNKPLVLMGILLLVILERFPTNYYLSSTLKNPYTEIVAKSKTKGVLDIPVSFGNSVYDTLAINYGKNIVSGYFIWSADTSKSQSFINQPILKRFVCGEEFQTGNLYSSLNKLLINELKKNDIKTIVVHKNDPMDHAKYYFPECANVRMQSSLLLPQLLMPDPTEKQEILSLFFPAIPTIGDTITFPDDGIFYLDGFHAFPKDWLPIHMYLDGKEIFFSQNWTDKGNKNATLDPFLKLDVKKGSKLIFAFDKNNNTDYSFVKIWYRYTPKTFTNPANYMPNYSIVKIYEDDDAAVFTIK